RRQGLSSGEIGGVIAAFGACSLFGSSLAPRVQRLLSMRAIIIGSVWVPLTISLFVLFPSVYVLLAVIVPMMTFLPTTNATVIGYRVAVGRNVIIGTIT